MLNKDQYYCLLKKQKEYYTLNFINKRKTTFQRKNLE